MDTIKTKEIILDSVIQFCGYTISRDILYTYKIEIKTWRQTNHSKNMNEIEISGCKLRVFETGEIQRNTKLGAWKVVKNSANHNKGYNVILIDKKQYMRSRLMSMAFMTRDPTDRLVMHHKDGDRLNCALSNLSIETYSSMSYYRTDTSGWQYDPSSNTYNASITKDGVLIQLGNFPTADLAYEEYIKMREILQRQAHEIIRAM